MSYVDYRNVNARLDVVIPVYQEETHIINSIGIIKKILLENKINHRFILIDDGSKDKTWEKLTYLAMEDDAIIAIRLSRNFGKEAALCAGLECSDGYMVIVMDADLQHPPSLIPLMVKAWREEGVDVVEGVKNKRGNEKLLYRICAKTFYKFIYKTSSIDLTGASDFKLLDKKVVKAWKTLSERTTFFRGMSAWVGFSRRQIPFDVSERVDGVTKWSFLRLLKLAVNAITSYTTVPLHFISFLGGILLVISFIIGIQTIYMKIAGYAVGGITTIILLLLFIGSCIMISLGIIGIYLTKIYHEVKERPRYLVSKCIKDKKEIITDV